jgi:hypothetical protein
MITNLWPIIFLAALVILFYTMKFLISEIKAIFSKGVSLKMSSIGV